tara:strand:- start:2141 stop:2464 length:324 start_codon:yes stop_codon:yes gene_type:complete
MRAFLADRTAIGQRIAADPLPPNCETFSKRLLRQQQTGAESVVVERRLMAENDRKSPLVDLVCKQSRAGHFGGSSITKIDHTAKKPNIEAITQTNKLPIERELRNKR